MLPEITSRIQGFGNALAGMPPPEVQEQAMVLAAAEPVNEDRPEPTQTGDNKYPGEYTPVGSLLQQIGIVDGIEVVPSASSAVAIYGDVLADLPKGGALRSDPRQILTADSNFLTELFDNPSDGLNNSQFWTWCGRQRAAYGECFIAIERDAEGWPVRLLPAFTRSARALRGGPVDQPGQRIALNIPSQWATGYGAMLVDYAIEDVLHVTDPSYDPFTGHVVRPLDGFARDAVGLHKAIVMRYMMRLMQGGHDQVIAQMPERKADYDAFMARYKEQIAGIWNSGKPFPVPHGTVMASLSATDVERETVQMLNWMTLEIARGFRIPPHLLYVRMTEGVSARARSDLAEMFLSWIRVGLSQFVHSFTHEIDKKIVRPMAEMGRRPAMNLVTRFDLDHLTQGTPAQRAEIAVKQRQAGVMKVDELRAVMGLPPLGGKEGNALVHSIGAAPTGNGGSLSSSEDATDEEDVVRSE